MISLGLGPETGLDAMFADKPMTTYIYLCAHEYVQRCCMNEW